MVLYQPIKACQFKDGKIWVKCKIQLPTSALKKNKIQLIIQFTSLRILTYRHMQKVPMNPRAFVPRNSDDCRTSGSNLYK